MIINQNAKVRIFFVNRKGNSFLMLFICSFKEKRLILQRDSTKQTY